MVDPDPDEQALDFRFRVGTSVLAEFAMSHSPAVTTQPVAGLATVGSHAPVVQRRVRRSSAWRSCLAPVWR